MVGLALAGAACAWPLAIVSRTDVKPATHVSARNPAPCFCTLTDLRTRIMTNTPSRKNWWLACRNSSSVRRASARHLSPRMLYEATLSFEPDAPSAATPAGRAAVAAVDEPPIWVKSRGVAVQAGVNIGRAPQPRFQRGPGPGSRRHPRPQIPQKPHPRHGLRSVIQLTLATPLGASVMDVLVVLGQPWGRGVRARAAAGRGDFDRCRVEFGRCAAGNGAWRGRR